MGNDHVDKFNEARRLKLEYTTKQLSGWIFNLIDDIYWFLVKFTIYVSDFVMMIDPLLNQL